MAFEGQERVGPAAFLCGVLASLISPMFAEFLPDDWTKAFMTSLGMFGGLGMVIFSFVVYRTSRRRSETEGDFDELITWDSHGNGQDYLGGMDSGPGRIGRRVR